MSNPLGTFDKSLVGIAWFDATQLPAGWFSSDFVTGVSGETVAGDVTEALTASDEVSASLAALASCSEALEASDVVSAYLITSASVTEELTVGDYVSASVIFSASVTEALNASDSVESSRIAAILAKVSWVQLQIPYVEVGASYRALVIVNGAIQQITDVLAGTGLKPLVLHNGVVQEQVASEGYPIILLDGALSLMPTNGTLII